MANSIYDVTTTCRNDVLTIRWSQSVDGGYQSVNDAVQLYWPNGTLSQGSVSVSGSGSYSMTFSNQGFVNGQYRIVITARSGNTQLATATHYWTYTSTSPWNWQASNGSATAAQTQAAYAAVTGQGYLSDFSYLVWNDMLEKADQCLAECGLTWNGTKPIKSSSSKMLTASDWNNFVTNVQIAYGYIVGGTYRPPEVSSGDIVIGSYFTRMMNDVNRIIQYL